MQSKIKFLGLALLAVAGVARAQGPEMMAMDPMQQADENQDGKVTQEEFLAFAKQRWSMAFQDADKVKVADLDLTGQAALMGAAPNADGYVTKDMFIGGAPARFVALDTDKNGTLDGDELSSATLQN